MSLVHTCQTDVKFPPRVITSPHLIISCIILQLICTHVIMPELTSRDHVIDTFYTY